MSFWVLDLRRLNWEKKHSFSVIIHKDDERCMIVEMERYNFMTLTGLESGSKRDWKR